MHLSQLGRLFQSQSANLWSIGRAVSGEELPVLTRSHVGVNVVNSFRERLGLAIFAKRASIPTTGNWGESLILRRYLSPPGKLFSFSSILSESACLPVILRMEE